MPATILLGKNQEFRIDGQVAAGVRDVEVSVSKRSVEVTGWDSPFVSSLPIVADASLTVEIYDTAIMGTIWGAYSAQPQVPLVLAITGVVQGPFLVSDISVGCPLNGVLAHRVTFKQYCYA